MPARARESKTSEGAGLRRYDSLRTRFTAAFALAAAVAVLAGGTALYELSATRAENRDFIRQGSERLRLAERLHAGLYRAQVAEDHFLTTNDGADLARFRQIVAEMSADGHAFGALGARHPESLDEQLRLLGEYEALVNRAAEITQGQRDVVDPAEFRGLLSRRDNVLRRAERASQETLNETLAAGSAYAERVEGSFQRLWLSMLVTSLVMLLGGGMLWRVGGRIVSRVIAMAGSIRAITTENDLEQRLDVDGRDEIATLASTFNALLGQQQVLLHELEQAAGRDKERADALEIAYAELRAATTELTRSQQKLLEADKLAAIGQLAAGVAHEINNPAAAVRTNLEWLRDTLVPLLELLVETHPLALAQANEETRKRLTAPRETRDLGAASSEVATVLAESLEITRRIAAIVRDLGTFSRRSDEIEVFDPTEALEVSLKMANHAIKTRATVVRRYEPLPPIRGNRGRLQQVFLNLLINAAQAMSKDRKNNEIRVSTTADDETVKIAITDTGTGIAPEHRARVFDPFFTTKDAGQGTGLGLAISYDIVRRLGGDMTLESEVGVGTTFTLTLPVHGPAERSAPPPALAAARTN
jgi:signal transduction histidine kinase